MPLRTITPDNNPHDPVPDTDFRVAVAQWDMGGFKLRLFRTVHKHGKALYTLFFHDVNPARVGLMKARDQLTEPTLLLTINLLVHACRQQVLGAGVEMIDVRRHEKLANIMRELQFVVQFTGPTKENTMLGPVFELPD